MQLFLGRGDKCEFVGFSGGEFRWANGSTLFFRHATNHREIDNYRGSTFAFIAINELSFWETEDYYNMISGANKFPGGKALMFSTTNAEGVGSVWVRRRFYDPAGYNSVIKKTVMVKSNPVKISQVCYHGNFYDNPNVPDEDRAKLELELQHNPSLKKSWIEGSWDTVHGGAFDNFDERVHVVKRIKLPDSEEMDRVMDWGSSSPCAILWCVTLKNDLTVSNHVLPVGSVVVVNELLLHKEGKPTEGLFLNPTQTAHAILEEEARMRVRGIISDKYDVRVGPADTQIFDRNVDNPLAETHSIAGRMEAAGVPFMRAYKEPGTRIQGKQLLRELLGEKKIFFTEDCPYLIDQLPRLQNNPKDPEDVLKCKEDHLYDALRYRLLRKPVEYQDQAVIRLDF